MQMQLWKTREDGEDELISTRESAVHPALRETDIQSFGSTLKSTGCDGCRLSHGGRSQVVVYRGNPEAKYMVAGEAPGAIEDACGLPFSGPAGRKLDAIIQSIGLDPNRDFYIGNIVKCRPIDHSGIKQNLTPTHECAIACRPFLHREIELLSPRVIICTGLTAARYLLDLPSKARMKDYSGTIHKHPSFPETEVLITYHPAAILHASSNPTLCNYIRNRIWNDVRMFQKRYVNEQPKREAVRAS